MRRPTLPRPQLACCYMEDQKRQYLTSTCAMKDDKKISIFIAMETRFDHLEYAGLDMPL